jgi:hypothetical protein
VFALSPVITDVNIPDATVSVVLFTVGKVGEPEVLHTTPDAVIADPPILVIFPPVFAVVPVTLDAEIVLTTGSDDPPDPPPVPPTTRQNDVATVPEES